MMEDQLVRRASTFQVLTPDSGWISILRTESHSRIDLGLWIEDVTSLAAEPGSVRVQPLEIAVLRLRPDVALQYARMLVKTLNAFVDDSPDQARALGISKESVLEIGKQEFVGRASSNRD